MNLKHIKIEKCFTLIEVLLSASILAVISAIMLSFFIQGSNLWQLITNQSDLRSIARNAMNYMRQELQNTTRTSPEIPSPNLSIPSKPNNNSVDFYLPIDIDGNGLIIDDIGNTEWDKSNKIQYQYVPGLRQLRRLEKGNKYVIANNVASIEFEDNSINPVLYNNELKIVLKLEKLTPQNRTVSISVTSIVKLRNQ
ncbi:MAG: hypothetical protein NC820_02635 [Candidatus Omnitrophica bacterium]|nr:hypothetical protein [Candidatus Omnitrophota bacterium]